MSNPQNILELIINDLHNSLPEQRLSAIELLWQTPFSSVAILNLLEDIATSDPSADVRKAAIEALQHPAHRAIQERATRLRADTRRTLIQEIKNWATAGIISAEQAEIIARKYDFDQIPTLSLRMRATGHPAPPEEEKSALPPAPPPSGNTSPAPLPAPTPKVIAPPAPARPPQPAPPRPTLLQTLTSEASIKIALYLGAFMVVAAALILSFLSETLRFPALIVTTAGFGAAAILFKKRLPPTSFTLFIVASILLVIDAFVLRDILKLTGQPAAIYWTVALGCMVLVWAGATWLYKSRFFTLMAFTALAASLQYSMDIFDPENAILHVLAASIAALAGILACAYLKKWQGFDFIIPFFAVLQGFQVILLTAAFIYGLLALTNRLSHDWIILAVTGLLAFLFYIASDTLFKFILFPWLAVGALMPIEGLIVISYHPGIWVYSIAAWGWGFAMLIASEMFLRTSNSELNKYSLPFNLSAIMLMLGGIIFGFVDSASLGCGLSLAAGAVMSISQAGKNRWWVWTSAIGFGLMAYFSAYYLIDRSTWINKLAYKIIAIPVLFAIIDLILKPSFNLQNSWRWPLRMYGLVSIAINSVYLLVSTRPEERAIILFLHGLIALAYAIRHNQPFVALLFTIQISPATLLALSYFKKLGEFGILAGTLLAIAYFTAGYLIRSKTSNTWSGIFRFSGLGLAAIDVILAFVFDSWLSGWCLLALSSLFIIESLTNEKFELGIYPLLSISYAFIVNDFRLYNTVILPAGLAFIIIAIEMAYNWWRPKRFYRHIIRAGSGISAIIALLHIFSHYPKWSHPWAYGLLALLYLVAAIYYRSNWVIYISNIFAGFSIFASLLVTDQLDAHWLPALTIVASAFYLLGYTLLKKRPEQPRWSVPYRLSGITLAISSGFCSLILPTVWPIPWAGIYLLILTILLVVETIHNPIFEITVYFLSGITYYLLLHEFSPSWLGKSALAFAIFTIFYFIIETRFQRSLFSRPWAKTIRIIGVLIALVTTASAFMASSHWESLLALLLLTVLALYLTLNYRQPLILYALTLTLTLTTLDLLTYIQRTETAWLPVQTGLALAFYTSGIGFLRTQLPEKWSHPMRYSALILGAFLTMLAPQYTNNWSGWYIALIAWLFCLETFRNARFEYFVHIGYSIAYLLILRESGSQSQALNLMGPTIIIAGLDTFFQRTITRQKAAYAISKLTGVLLALYTTVLAIIPNATGWQNAQALMGLATTSLALAWIRRTPRLVYGATTTLALATIVGTRTIQLNEWPWPLALLTAGYYTLGFYLLENKKTALGQVFLASGLAFSTLTALSAPLSLIGISISIPIALTATLWAAEAFRQRNVWLGFPANSLYLIAYSIILFDSGIREAQYYSVGAGLLGMLMHYLLRRSGNRLGTFITGMVSQLVLLGTAYIQMFTTESLSYFIALFFEGLAVLIYGLVIRSRSLVFAPMVFVVIGIVTVIFSVFRGLSTVILIGGTGILLIVLGTAALLLRERIIEVRDRLSDWEA